MVSRFSNPVVVSSTRFHNPQHQLVKWFPNDGRPRNQIDHMIVRSRWASSVIDCRAYTGAYWKVEDMGNHGSGRPGTTLWIASLRPRTMVKGLGESLYRAAEAGVPQSEAWSTQLVMPVQPASGEVQVSKYFYQHVQFTCKTCLRALG